MNVINSKIGRNERAVAILKLLAEHGPLTVNGLKEILQPPIQTKRLRESLSRLYAKELLEKRFDRMFGNAAVYHQIAQNPAAQVFAAHLMGVKPDELKQPQYRHRELIHGQTCVLWAEYFKWLFPFAQIVREHNFSCYPLIVDRLFMDENISEIRPDLIIIAESNQPKAKPILVAVEIERKRKTHERLFIKLKKYARGTTLDGVIYICPEGIGNRVLQIYQSRVLERAIRIRHYGKSFLLFLNGASNRERKDFEALNMANETVSIQKWMHWLITVPLGEQRLQNIG